MPESSPDNLASDAESNLQPPVVDQEQAIASMPTGPDWILVKPRPGWHLVDFAEVWRFREMLWTMAMRDVKVRYKQALLGFIWVVAQPLLTVLIFTVLFGLLLGQGNQPSAEGVPYSLNTFAAMLPWGLFARGLTMAGNSLVVNRNMITKIYFPKIIIPTASTLAGLVDFLASMVVLVLMVAGFSLLTDYSFVWSWNLLLVPMFVVLSLLTCMSIVLWISAMSAIFRDVRYLTPMLTQLLMFVSPIIYAPDRILNAAFGEGQVPDWSLFLYYANPIATVVEGFRWSLLGASPPPFVPALVGLFGLTLLLISGLLIFRRLERTIADVV